MKKLFILLSTVAMLTTACDGFGVEDDNGDNTEQPGNGGTPADKTKAIKFADAKVKQICVTNWDENDDGELSYEEAAAVTNIGNAFENSEITSFNELQYFTSLKTIAEFAFLLCKKLTSITIPDSVTEIGDYAFSGCSGLTNVTIPDSVTKIGGGVFANCDNLKSFYGKFASKDNRCLIIDGVLISFAPAGITTYNIPDNVTKIGGDAFSDCDNLTSVTIPDSVTNLGESAFSECDNLKSFYGKFASNDNRCLIVNGELNSFAPAGLTTYNIPDNVTKIGSWVFYDCGNLTSVTIPDSVTEIGYDAFACCSSLNSITIPEGVTFIDEYAFEDCASLTSVYCMPTTPPEIGEEVFTNHSPDLTIFVPKGCVEDYQTQWSEWENMIAENNGNNDDVAENKKIYYTATEKVEPNETEAFGANIVSNDFDPNTGKGIIIFDDIVTSIGEYAFFNCSRLTSVTIPDSVTSIGEYAFYYCDILTDATIPDSVTSIGDYAFSDCSSLTSVTIPDSVTSIEESAFSHCSSLTSVTIGDSVTSIEESAFSHCSSLTSVTIGDSVTSIGHGAFYGCSSLTSFYGKFASSDNRCWIVDGVLVAFAPANLTSYTIPDSVTSIGSSAFSNCRSLTSVTIPDSVTSIGDNAFWGCSSLTSVTIPDSVTSIGEYAFWVCISLTSITIPDSVTSIGNSAFFDCRSLTSFYGKFASSDNRCWIVDGVLVAFAPANLTSYTIPDSVTSIGSDAFSHCRSLTSITIPDNVTSIEESAFSNCRSLTSVTIPDSVTSIEESAFSHCSSLASVTIGDSVTSIGSYAFSSCSSLASVTIGDSVTSIGNSAFRNCSSLTSVYCKPTTPPSLGGLSFDSNASDRKIYVPRNSVSAYKAANHWADYADDIVGYDF